MISKHFPLHRLKLQTIALVSLLLVACDAPLQLTPLSVDATIVAFGDSLTYGTGAKSSESYPEVLRNLTDLKVINSGVPGNKTLDGLNRVDAMLTKHSPDLVLLCLGGNDFLRKRHSEETKRNLIEIIQRIQQNHSEVVLIAVPEIGIFLSDSGIYEEVARETNVPLMQDVLSDLLSDNQLKSDTIHLNKLGYQKLAESIHQFLHDRGALPTL